MLILANLVYSAMVVVDGETWALYSPDDCCKMYGRKSTEVKFEMWLIAIHS